MAILSYKQTIISELGMAQSVELLDLVDTHWDRFASSVTDELRYLLTKRAVVRTLLSKSKNKVDVMLGFDQIKSSQVVANLEKILKDINNEIDEAYPEVSNSNLLISHSGVASIYDEE